MISLTWARTEAGRPVHARWYLVTIFVMGGLRMSHSASRWLNQALGLSVQNSGSRREEEVVVAGGSGMLMLGSSSSELSELKKASLVAKLSGGMGQNAAIVVAWSAKLCGLVGPS
jgi:hypothetical protein